MSTLPRDLTLQILSLIETPVIGVSTHFKETEIYINPSFGQHVKLLEDGWLQLYPEDLSLAKFLELLFKEYPVFAKLHSLALPVIVTGTYISGSDKVGKILYQFRDKQLILSWDLSEVNHG